MLRFGVLGAGRIGKVHARTIAASGKAKVAYLADALPKAAEDLAIARNLLDQLNDFAPWYELETRLGIARAAAPAATASPPASHHAVE